METLRLDGRLLANQIQQKLKEEVRTLPRKPRMSVIYVGDNPASRIYINMKTRIAESIGIEVTVHKMPEQSNTEQLTCFVQKLNEDPSVDGILIQLPLPKHLDTNAAIEAISPSKDVDGLTSKNQGGLMTGYPTILPCTPLGCLRLIHQARPILTGLNAVVVGRSRLVGRPMAQLLLNENCTVAQAHSHTQNLMDICARADILVSATGIRGLIKRDFVKPGAIVIDVGISKTEDGSIAGDVDAESVMGQAGWLTPVPGGVGPMTVAMIMSNMVNIVKHEF
ncbi:MAG: bifunctional 5,10-methylenetetrahydrofolate dehydrogenase/5,10-methenyltetrahydrofolate cyclohydrolase [Alphaproteobacteria bacterium]|nr:bifunctional 5,10-methylenetetrahydrofolate dehydrogenase/5,10-methenyltetrahydrofolate cyclohydrolase [Alphaproteobacteria bacterium]